MDFNFTPPAPSPVIQAPVPHGLLLELAEACRQELLRAEDISPSPRCFSQMLAIRDVFFLAQGPLHVWTHGDDRAWAALEIASSEGLFYLTSSGRLGSFGKARQEALEQLGPNVQEHTLEQPTARSLLGHLDMQGQDRHEKNMRSALERYGLGMHFSVLPGVARASLDLEALKEELWQFSCHPYFARAIHQDLVEHGQRSTTTQFLLVRSFHEIVAAVKPLGIGLCRSWPKPHAGNSNHVPAEEPMPGPPRRFKV